MTRAIGSKEKALRAQREADLLREKREAHPLTVQERTRLAECERVITEGLQSFVEVGAALVEVRDTRLYRETHDTFADYCRERWSMGRSYAYRLIDATAVVESMSPPGRQNGSLPPTERHARALGTLKAPEERVEAWQEAVDEAGGTPTAKQVEAAVGRRTKPPSPPEPPSDEPDPVREWERAEKEVERLEGLVTALQVSDAAKEIVALSKKYAQLEGRLQQANNTAREAAKDATYRGTLLQKIRKALGVEKDAEILPAIQDLRR